MEESRTNSDFCYICMGKASRIIEPNISYIYEKISHAVDNVSPGASHVPGFYQCTITSFDVQVCQ
jgi:phage-related protein